MGCSTLLLLAGRAIRNILHGFRVVCCRAHSCSRVCNAQRTKGTVVAQDCLQLAAEVNQRYFSLCVEKAQLVKQFEDALDMGRASLSDCRREVARVSDSAQDSQGLYGTFKVQQFQAFEQEARMHNRLDAVLHVNTNLRAEIPQLREKVPHTFTLACTIQKYTIYLQISVGFAWQRTMPCSPSTSQQGSGRSCRGN